MINYGIYNDRIIYIIKKWAAEYVAELRLVGKPGASILPPV